MRTSIFLGTALSVLCATGIASAAKTTYTATMTGLKEKPNPVVTVGTGTAVITYDDVTKKLCGQVTYQGLTSAVINAHIHNGDENTAGGVFQLLAGFQASPFKVNVTLDATQATNFMDLQANPKYVNIHTQNNQGGEIRGQLDVGGAEQSCDAPDAGTDGGTEAGTDAGSSSGSSGTSSGASSGTSGNTSSGTSGATTNPSPDAGGTTPASSSSGEDDGCNTTGTNTGNGLAIGLGAMIAIGFIARARKRTKR